MQRRPDAVREWSTVIAVLAMITVFVVLGWRGDWGWIVALTLALVAWSLRRRANEDRLERSLRVTGAVCICGWAMARWQGSEALAAVCVMAGASASLLPVRKGSYRRGPQHPAGDVTGSLPN